MGGLIWPNMTLKACTYFSSKLFLYTEDILLVLVLDFSPPPQGGEKNSAQGREFKVCIEREGKEDGKDEKERKRGKKEKNEKKKKRKKRKKEVKSN